MLEWLGHRHVTLLRLGLASPGVLIVVSPKVVPFVGVDDADFALKGSSKCVNSLKSGSIHDRKIFCGL